MLDSLNGLIDVERINRHVTRVHHLGLRERRSIRRWIVWAQQAGRLAHMVGTKARAGAVGDTGVKRNADYLDASLSVLCLNIA